MRLLSTLASGVSGAEGGTVEIYQRGTTTRATLYQDFEGKQPTLLSPVTLDAYGGAVVYVNEYVDIVALGYSGETVRSWTEGDSGSGVEIISAKFAGTDYETAETGVAKPVNLVTVLESLKTSIETNTTNLSALSVPFFVVTDAVYGAVGNGTDDDVVAIQAAIDAAHAAGGGVVFFPAGNYLCEAEGLDLYEDVTLLGASPTASVLWAAAAIDDELVAVDMAHGGRAVIRSLQLDAHGSTGRPAISALGGASSAKLLVEDCIIGASRYFSDGIYAEGFRANVVTVSGCTLYGGAVRAVTMDYNGGAPTLQMIGGRVVCGTGLSADEVSMYGGAVVGVLFDNVAMTSGDSANVFVGGSGTEPSVLCGNTFSAPTTGTSSYAIESHNTLTVDAGNYVSEGQLCSYQYTGSGVGEYTQTCSSRSGRANIENHSTSAAATADTARFATLYYYSTTATGFALTLPACPVGWELCLVFQNQHGSSTLGVNITGTWQGTPYYVSVLAVNTQVIRFRSMALGDGSGSVKWALESTEEFAAVT